MNTSVGIDVSARKFDAAVLREGKKPAVKGFDNDPSGFALLSSWLKSFDSPRITMEATGVYHLDPWNSCDAEKQRSVERQSACQYRAKNRMKHLTWNGVSSGLFRYVPYAVGVAPG